MDVCVQVTDLQQPNTRQGHLIREASKSVTHHSRQDSSGRRIGPSQTPLPDNTQHSQEADIYAPGGIRTNNHSTLSATGIGNRPTTPVEL
jgi:hypothetical protein